MPPTISVVIPLYNKLDYIERCLQSVFDQTCDDYELIVVNDGSSDGSGELAESLMRPDDTIIHQDNAGCSAARNRGWQAASSDLIAFLDADDEWLPEHLETLAALWKQFPDAGLLAAGYQIMGQKGLVIETTVDTEEPKRIENYFYHACSGSFISMSGCAVPRNVLEKLEGFRDTPYQCEDTDLEVRIGLQYPMAYHPEITSIIHTEAEGRSHTLDDWWPDVPPFVEVLMDRAETREIPEDLRDAVRQYGATRIFAHALEGAISGNRTEVLELLDNPWLVESRVSFDASKLRLALRYLPLSLIRRYLQIRKSRLFRPSLQIENGVKREVVSRFSLE